jgi:hypothetical protein
MSPIKGDPACEHEWVEYDDLAAYNDGLNCPVVTICSRCGAEMDIRQKYAEVNHLRWYEALLIIPFSIFAIVYLCLVAPLITLMGGIVGTLRGKQLIA